MYCYLGLGWICDIIIDVQLHKLQGVKKKVFSNIIEMSFSFGYLSHLLVLKISF